jgi:translation initiation factor IF-2
MLKIGTVTSIQKSQKDVKSVRSQDGGVSIKIENNSKIIHAGKSFTHENQIVSAITRDSIDVLKAHYKDELEKDDWRLVVKLKKVFNIV